MNYHDTFVKISLNTVCTVILELYGKCRFLRVELLSFTRKRNAIRFCDRIKNEKSEWRVLLSWRRRFVCFVLVYPFKMNAFVLSKIPTWFTSCFGWFITNVHLYNRTINNTNFFNIVNDQPSTAMSCVAAKKFMMIKTHDSTTTFVFPVSDNKSSMSLAVNIKIVPVLRE